MSQRIEVRPMRRKDLPPVLELINKEGWEYELVDVERILDLDPDNSVVAVADEQVIGGVTVACHRNRGILGHVVVREGWRKKGIGRQMMMKVIENLDSKKIGIIELYAVPDAVGFYHRHGFHKIGDLVIYKGSIGKPMQIAASRSKVRNLTAQDLDNVIDMDRKIVGFDRSNVIEKLMLPYLDESVGLFDREKLVGFALGRSAEREAEIGPWIMMNPNREDGTILLAATMERLHNRKAFIEIPAENPLANAIVRDLGFELKADVQRFVRTELAVGQFGPGVMSYAALEFG